MIKDPTRMYCAVRLDTDSGREWLDCATMSGGCEAATYSAEKTDAEIPDYARANPVQRIAPVEIHEIEEA